MLFAFEDSASVCRRAGSCDHAQLRHNCITQAMHAPMGQLSIWNYNNAAAKNGDATDTRFHPVEHLVESNRLSKPVGLYTLTTPHKEHPHGHTYKQQSNMCIPACLLKSIQRRQHTMTCSTLVQQEHSSAMAHAVRYVHRMPANDTCRPGRLMHLDHSCMSQ